VPHPIHQYCTQSLPHFCGPLKCPTQFTNIAPTSSTILVGHLNTTPNSPIVHLKSYPFEWATYIMHPIQLKISTIPVGHWNTPPNWSILHSKSQDFEWVTKLLHTIHQDCHQNPTHLNGPWKCTTQFTNIALKISTSWVGHWITHQIHEYCTKCPSHLSGPHNYPTWFIYTASKITPIWVGNLNTPSGSPIFHWKYHPLEWGT
jgi:hypothetical protein